MDRLDQLEEFARRGMNAQAAVDELAKKAAEIVGEEDAVPDLAKALGVDPTAISDFKEEDKGGTFTAEGIEYRFFNGEDEAYSTAVDQVKEDLSNEPEIFNQDWLQGHFDGDRWLDDFHSDAEEWVRESPESYTTFIDNEEPAEEDGTYSDDQIEKMLEGYLNDIRERGVLEFLKGDLGYDGDALAKQILSYIDINEASEDAVDTDGWPHFLSRYDGEYETTDGGLVYFREN